MFAYLVEEWVTVTIVGQQNAHLLPHRLLLLYRKLYFTNAGVLSVHKYRGFVVCVIYLKEEVRVFIFLVISLALF